MARRVVKVVAEDFDLKAMIDRGYDLDQIMKATEKELKLIKSKLLEVGEKEGKKILEGNKHSVVISSNTKNTINPLKFFDAMKLAKNLAGFFSSITVGNTKAKEVMNEFDLEKITTSETNEYGKISFK